MKVSYIYMKLFLFGEVVKRIKIFILAVIAVCTLMSIVYLSLIARKMEQYTISRNDGERCFIVCSMKNGSLSDQKDLGKLVEYTAKSLKSAGYDAVTAGSSDIKDEMKKNKKYYMIDINSTKLLVNKNSAILRIGNNNNPKYNDNLEYAKYIKANVKDIKVNVISDEDDNYNQDAACRSVRIEISDRMDYESASKCISILLKPIIQ